MFFYHVIFCTGLVQGPPSRRRWEHWGPKRRSEQRRLVGGVYRSGERPRWPHRLRVSSHFSVGRFRPTLSRLFRLLFVISQRACLPFLLLPRAVTWTATSTRTKCAPWGYSAGLSACLEWPSTPRTLASCRSAKSCPSTVTPYCSSWRLF